MTKIQLGGMTIQYEIKSGVSWVTIRLPFKKCTAELDIRYAPLSEAGQVIGIELQITQERVNNA